LIGEFLRHLIYTRKISMNGGVNQEIIGEKAMHSSSSRLSVALFALLAIAMSSTGVLARNGIRSLPEKGKMSIAPALGTSFTVGGDFINNAAETLVTADTIFGLTINVTIGLEAPSQDFSDVFDQPVTAGLGVNYGLSSSSEVFGALRRTRARSNQFDALNVTAAGTLDGTAFALSAAIQGNFDDYEDFGLEVGYRHFFNPSNKFKPFVSVVGGLKRVSSMDLDLLSGGASIVKLKFYDSSVAVTAGLNVGFRYDVSDGVAIGLETGVRYEGNLSDDDTDLAGVGSFENVNDDGDRVEIPVMVHVVISF
jgi:hypothetical protein